METKAKGVLAVTSHSRRVEFQVRVQPRASCNEVCGSMDGALRVRLTAPPVEGKANQALQEFLARLLKVPRRQVEIVSGEASRTKRVVIRGLAIEELERRLVGAGTGLMLHPEICHADGSARAGKRKPRRS